MIMKTDINESKIFKVSRRDFVTGAAAHLPASDVLHRWDQARSRAFASVAVGSWLQDAQLLPHTINTAIAPKTPRPTV